MNASFLSVDVLPRLRGGVRRLVSKWLTSPTHRYVEHVKAFQEGLEGMSGETPGEAPVPFVRRSRETAWNNEVPGDRGALSGEVPQNIDRMGEFERRIEFACDRGDDSGPWDLDDAFVGSAGGSVGRSSSRSTESVLPRRIPRYPSGPFARPPKTIACEFFLSVLGRLEVHFCEISPFAHHKWHQGTSPSDSFWGRARRSSGGDESNVFSIPLMQLPSSPLQGDRIRNAPLRA